MGFEIVSSVFLVVIFTLVMIFGSSILKEIWNFRKELHQMTRIIRELCGDVNDYNRILCDILVIIKKYPWCGNQPTVQQKKQVDDDHNFII